MSEFLEYLSANDNDIYDILVSGKQRLTLSVLREFALDRGIICSPHDEREDISDFLSLLPHGYHDIEAIVQKREPGHRREKTTFVHFSTSIPTDELKNAVEDYIKTVGGNEKVVHRPKSGGGYTVNIEYDEFHKGRSRLLQRERHEADIDFLIEDGKTVVRLPSTEKAKRVANAIKDSVERRTKSVIQEESVDLIGLTSPELRSKFFTRLISSLPGFKLKNVMNLKVSSNRSEDTEEDEALDLEDDQEREASMEMFAVVHSMALSGKNLVQSQEYKDLTARGFYITSISWRSEHEGNPPDIIQFDAGFEDRKRCTGFKYSIAGAYRSYKGGHRKTIVHVDSQEKSKLFSLIEATAKKVLADLLLEAGEGVRKSTEKNDE